MPTHCAVLQWVRSSLTSLHSLYCSRLRHTPISPFGFFLVENHAIIQGEQGMKVGAIETGWKWVSNTPVQPPKVAAPVPPPTTPVAAPAHPAPAPSAPAMNAATSPAATPPKPPAPSRPVTPTLAVPAEKPTRYGACWAEVPKGRNRVFQCSVSDSRKCPGFAHGLPRLPHKELRNGWRVQLHGAADCRPSAATNPDVERRCTAERQACRHRLERSINGALRSHTIRSQSNRRLGAVFTCGLMP